MVDLDVDEMPGGRLAVAAPVLVGPGGAMRESGAVRVSASDASSAPSFAFAAGVK
jgi:hypothetical protein